ncbi:uncharacterized protein N0V89_008992 [Didymosphaeria variabile]|uniref:DUF6594 domain-containing protein n=1 Tax=Didymosphaeria variabile TaxID=1932322 RepID=A0A9W8XJ90_9PLEO|nr:uncharacterized protein N0V89_008992 [Didymosphaeria variabile]KAJ4350371.1 hypothetical protein N0V89_008992 [Didymosphaeria variabile]
MFSEKVPEGMLPKWESLAEELDACVPGYPRLAREMEQAPASTIFRRFSALNARNLLYLQRDLIMLENRLKQVEYRDSISTKGFRQHYAKDSNNLHYSTAFGDSVQWNLMLQVRERLKEYNETLVLQSIILKLPVPDDYDVKDISCFIHLPQGMNAPLSGSDKATWGLPEQPDLRAADLVTLKPRRKEDRFSNFVSEHAIRYVQWPLKLFQSKKKREEHHGMVTYKDRTIHRATYIIIGTLAGLAPILSIIVLTKLHTMKARLWTTAVFNVGIAFSLQLFTEAKRMDIFAVTAALV